LNFDAAVAGMAKMGVPAIIAVGVNGDGRRCPSPLKEHTTVFT
jgi:hypothetical protein